MSVSRKRVSVDVGGTFTDCLVLDEASGALSQFKTPTVPEDPAAGFMHAMERAARRFDQSLDAFLGSVDVLVHGTTLATNTLLTGSGAKLGMLTTREFRDILELRRGIKPVGVSLYNMFIPPNRPLVPRSRRLEVTERTLYTGEILERLNEPEVADAVGRLRDEGVESIAVCFLHAYANGANERRAAAVARDVAPGIHVTTSHETLPVWREFERFNTTAVGAYVGPAVARYLESLEARLGRCGFGGTLLIMLANGLVQRVAQCARRGVHLLHSGPAAAPSAAAYLGPRLDAKDLLSVDMGGTSFDVCLMHDRVIPTTTESWIADQRVAIKMVDIETVGAGGGSIARIDSLGLLEVGPESAGADPGPACYGRGEQPTVTDADLLLGYLSPDYFLGGEMGLDPERAGRAMERIARPLGLDRVGAAEAVFTTVNANMADLITEVSTRRGHDLRDCVMVAGGGGGPVHAGFIAARLGLSRVVVPSVSALYSAFGMFAMDLGQDYARSYVTRLARADLETVNRLYREMEAEALAAFEAIGVAAAAVTMRRTAEMRYLGQFHEVEVEMAHGELDPAALEAAAAAFGRRHEALFTFCVPAKPVELLILRLEATTPNPRFELPPAAAGEGTDPGPALERRRRCRFGGEDVDTPVYRAERLRAGNVAAGPAIIEAPATTVVVPPGFRCVVDPLANYVLSRAGGDAP